MSPPEPIVTRNAILERAEISYDLSSARVEISLNYGSASQQVGPIVASQTLICQLLKISRSNLWSDISGKPIRVRCTRSNVLELGDFLIDDWIDLSNPEKSGLNSDDMPF